MCKNLDGISLIDIKSHILLKMLTIVKAIKLQKGSNEPLT